MTDQAEPMDADAERVAERDDARRRLADLHAVRAALAPDADDAVVLSEMSVVDSMIRAAEALLHESDAGEDTAA